MANIPEISLAPAELGHIGPVTITNTMVSTFAVSLILIVFALILRTKLSLKPGRLQVSFEMIFTFILNQMIMAFGSEKRARRAFPLIFTIFIFVLLSNYFTLIPFVDSITLGDQKLLSTPTAHYSLTITLALIILGTAHIISIAISPLRYIGNFIKVEPVWNAIKKLSVKDFFMSLIDVFLGLMDIIGEMAKLVSISTRLFGNMFAGGVIVAIISGLSFYTQFVVPLPFGLLGLLSGVVQAFVFSILGTLFIGGMINNIAPLEKEITPQANSLK